MVLSKLLVSTDNVKESSSEKQVRIFKKYLYKSGLKNSIRHLVSLHVISSPVLGLWVNVLATIIRQLVPEND